MIFLWFAIIPIVLSGVAYVFLHQRITFTELAIQLVISLLVAWISCVIVYHQDVDDLETWNGTVVDKDHVQVSCEHSYPCNPHDCGCTTDNNGNQSCSTCWDTCYEHSYDIDWRIITTIGSVTVDRIDSQGVDTPPRWSASRAGEPVALTTRFENPIKAAPGTLFRRQGLVEKYEGRLFAYPNAVYDYHYMNRIVSTMREYNTPELQRAFSDMNAQLQSSKANAIMVIVQDTPREYALALEQHWVGGKKNDAILIVSVDKERRIQWVHVSSWTSHEMFKVELRKHIEGLDTFDPMQAMIVMERDVKSMFEHRSMNDFEYLKASIVPSVTQWVVSLIINLLVSGLALAFMAQDTVDIRIGGSDSRVHFRRRRW